MSGRTFRGLLMPPLMAGKRQVVLNVTGPMEPMPEPAGSRNSSAGRRLVGKNVSEI